MILKNSYGQQFTFDEMVQSVIEYIKADRSFKYNLIIGSDSQVHKGRTTFVTVIVIHRIGRGAKLFYVRTVQNKRMDLAERILQETGESIEIMRQIMDTQIKGWIPESMITIHIDAGYGGKSRSMIPACVGYVEAMGFNCRTKPNAFVASYAADKFCRK